MPGIERLHPHLQHAIIHDLGWRSLSPAARLYVAGVIVSGAWVLVSVFPADYRQPFLFATLLTAGCFTSAWKVNST